MIVLHGVWHATHGLCVWGEDSSMPKRAPRPRAGGRVAHPFACSSRELAGVLEACGVDAKRGGVAGAWLEMWLASHARGPAASPFLEDPEEEANPYATISAVPDRLGLWGVPALALSGALALDLATVIGDARDGRRIAPDLRVADDLRFVADLAKAALSEVARGRVLPAIERANGAYAASWRPAGAGTAGEPLARFLAAMPPSVRAAESELEPEALLDGAFAQLVDATVRRSLQASAWADAGAAADEAPAGGTAADAEAAADEAPAGGTASRRGGSGQSPRSGRTRRDGWSAAAAWCDALASESGEVEAGGIAVERAGIALDEWIRPLREASTRGFRLCLRLEPPPEPEDDGAPAEAEDDAPPGAQDNASPSPQDHAPAYAEDDASPSADAPPAAAQAWRLEFLLQATDDPTLLVPAAEVWRTRGRVLSAAGRRLEDPQERLLEDLGRALRLYPPLEAALLEAAPTGLVLDTGAAHAFLSVAAVELEQGGLGVLVPSWWRSRGSRLGLRLRARAPATESASASESSAGLLGIDAVCAYDWRIALGEETLTVAEFERLARLKQPLVRVRGRWVELNAADIEAALATIARGVDRPLTVADVLRAGSGARDAAGGLPVLGIAADGWLDELLSGTTSERVGAAPAPAGLAGELRPYQLRGLGWLAFLDRLGLGACLADDMGLGKTIQLLALLLAERESERVIGPTLLVCPMSVAGNWQREAARFAPSLRVHVHHGGDRLAGEEFARGAGAADLVITTYGLAARDHEVLATVAWYRIALDEAQNIKNSATRQSRALRSLTAARRVALTGTPVENRLTELWSILDFLNPGLLGTRESFKRRFATPIERYGDDDAATALRRLSAPFILRRVKTDRSIIDDLPERIDIKEYCSLTREQASLYQAVVDEMLAKIAASDGIERRGLVLATMLRLKQVCNHPAHLMADGSPLDGRSGKLARLEDVLEEAVTADERALVFTQFAEWGHQLRSHLRHRLGHEIAFLHGGTSKQDRDRMVERFQSGSGAPVLLLSLKAGGTGLNLTAANHVVHFDRWWNPAVEDQASDRAYRIGQTRNVQVRKFVCAGTLEERIDEMIERKKSLADRIVGTGEAWLTELSTDELRRVIALSADAVAE